jgi:hypothetical protein
LRFANQAGELGDIGIRPPSPQSQSAPQSIACCHGIGDEIPTTSFQRFFKYVGIDLGNLSPEEVPGPSTFDGLVDGGPEVRDVGVNGVQDLVRRFFPPDPVNQVVGCDYPARSGGEHGKKGSLLGASQLGNAALGHHLNRSKDANLDPKILDQHCSVHGVSFG